MTVTTTKLTRAAGLAAVAAGLIFIGVQVKHPHLDAVSITTTEMVIRDLRTHTTEEGALARKSVEGPGIRRYRSSLADRRA